MTIEERKEIFRHLLDLIFFDACPEVEDKHLTSFYSFLLNSLEMRSEMHVSKDSDDFFVIQSILSLLSEFHIMDNYILLQLSKSHLNFRFALKEKTGLAPLFIEQSMERMISDFQDIKHGYLFCQSTTKD